MDDSQAAQLLADVMIKRKANKEKKTLTPNYWNSLVWKKEFQQQKIAAYGLLKLYSYEAIFNGINHKAIKWVYSLRNKTIVPYIKDEHARLQLRDEKIKKHETIVVPEQTGEIDIMGTGKKRRKLD